MGCLFFPLELLVDGIIEGWFYLMEWIIPERYITRTVRIVLKVFVWILSSLLFVIMFLGVFAIISPDPDTHLLGKYMIFIPLGISVIQILLGIIVRIISKKKKKKIPVFTQFFFGHERQKKLLFERTRVF